MKYILFNKNIINLKMRICKLFVWIVGKGLLRYARNDGQGDVVIHIYKNSLNKIFQTPKIKLDVNKFFGG